MANLTTGRLKASRRIDSGKVVFPAIPAHATSARFFEPINLSEEAQLYSFTRLHTAEGADPVTVVYADFPEGARAFGRLVLSGSETAYIGMRLRAVIEEDDQASLRYHFEPVREA